MDRFSKAERAVLLAVKGAGPTVVQRLEELGINTLAQLAVQDAQALTQQASAMLGSTCWRNSPQARAAMAAAIEAVRAAQP